MNMIINRGCSVAYPQDIALTELIKLVLPPALGIHEQVIDRDPDLCLELWHPTVLVPRDRLPLGILELLPGSLLLVLTNPGADLD